MSGKSLETELEISERQRQRDLITKWDTGTIKAKEHTVEQLNEFVESRLLSYQRDNISDRKLWSLFRIEFQTFNTEMLIQLNTKLLIRLREYL